MDLTVLQGEGMSARHVAWTMIADVAEKTLKVPGLDADEHARLVRLLSAARQASGEPAPVAPTWSPSPPLAGA